MGCWGQCHICGEDYKAIDSIRDEITGSVSTTIVCSSFFCRTMTRLKTLPGIVSGRAIRFWRWL